MSTGQRVAFWTWTVVVVVAVILIDVASLSTKQYSGPEVEFSTSSGWTLEISTSVSVEAADSSYFRLVQGGEQFYGIPKEPPLDYQSTNYFHNSGTLNGGQWEIAEGGATLRMIPNDGRAVTVEVWPSAGTITVIVVLSVIVGFIVWITFIGLATC